MSFAEIAERDKQISGILTNGNMCFFMVNDFIFKPPLYLIVTGP